MIYQKRDEYLFVKETRDNNYLAHMHRQVEIFYVLDGAIEITISSQKKLLKKGMISIAFPNMVHETHTPEHSLAVMIIFNHDFLPDFSVEFHTQHPLIPFITDLQNSERFSSLVSGLSESTQKNTDIRIAKGYLYILTAIILSQMTLVRQKTISTGICQDISNYLNQHFTEELSLSQLATALGYSKYHISHIFKNNFGCSYNDYLKRLRSEHAMGLLTHSELSMTEVCFASGFNSLRSFYRAFHEVYGTAPGTVK
ncbi:MAG: AraC family transcriptional regulator [Lachnospiraceae bacterium]